jgi:hypothetical protein
MGVVLLHLRGGNNFQFGIIIVIADPHVQTIAAVASLKATAPAATLRHGSSTTNLEVSKMRHLDQVSAQKRQLSLESFSELWNGPAVAGIFRSGICQTFDNNACRLDIFNHPGPLQPPAERKIEQLAATLVQGIHLAAIPAIP